MQVQIQSHTFSFPKGCNQEVMLRMVIMLMSVTQIDVSVWPGNSYVSEEEITAFNTAHPEFIVPYIDLMNFCRMVNIDNHVKLKNISVIPGSGTGVIVVELTAKDPFVQLGGL